MTRCQPLVTPPPATTGDRWLSWSRRHSSPNGSRNLCCPPQETHRTRCNRLSQRDLRYTVSALCRAAEITTTFESEAKTVFAIGGGDDEMRIIRHLDLPRLRDNRGSLALVTIRTCTSYYPRLGSSRTTVASSYLASPVIRASRDSPKSISLEHYSTKPSRQSTP